MPNLKKILKFYLYICTIIFAITLYSLYVVKLKQAPNFIYSSGEKIVCKDCSVILVSVDALSANHLPCYRYQRDTAPNLCKFAEDNIMFNNAYANATWTLPSHVSIFTGLYVQNHGVTRYDVELGEESPFLPSILKENGYETFFVIPEDDPTLPRDYVYKKGIDGFFDYNLGWDEAIQKFKDNLNKNKKTFLFLHTYDIHAPYLVETEKLMYTNKTIDKIPSTKEEFENFTDGFIDYFKTQLGTIQDSDIRNQLEILYKNSNGHADLREKLVNFKQGNGGLFWTYFFHYHWLRNIDINNNNEVDYIRSLYDQRIYETDESKVVKLVSLFRDNKLGNQTILIITSDHGEEFMEHGRIDHQTIYDSNLKIPLIMYVPKVKNKTIDSLAQSVDIVPTILDILDLDDYGPFDGRSLIGDIMGAKIQDRILVAEGETRSIRYKKWKLLLAKQEDGSYLPYELYNINNDPQEKTNLLFSRLEISKEILSIYNEQIVNPD